MRLYDIGYDQALDLCLNHCPVSENYDTISIAQAVDRVLAHDIRAKVDSPSSDVSLKDGYAVISEDVSNASKSSPVSLRVVDSIGAGSHTNEILTAGHAIRIMSGAPIPLGADAVLADEFTESDNGSVLAFNDAHPGRNILFQGLDVKKGAVLALKNSPLTPKKIALLAAGGIAEMTVFQKPRVALLATGDEVILPGTEIESGKIFASNIMFQQAWLKANGYDTHFGLAGDSYEELTISIKTMLSKSDVIITSGGVWKGDRDIMVRVMDHLGWQLIFHRVRMGPGKAVAFGLLGDKPVFCLPGGPASNEMAFLMLVIPAILKISGLHPLPHLRLTARLESDVYGQKDWTQFLHCAIINDHSDVIIKPLRLNNRFQSMSQTQAIFRIPEGIEKIDKDTSVNYLAIN